MSVHTCTTCGATGKVTWSNTGERHAHLASCSRPECPTTVAAARFAALIPMTPQSETIRAFCETAGSKAETIVAIEPPTRPSKVPRLGVVEAVKCAIAYGTTVANADVDDWLLYTHWSNRMVIGTAERTHDRTDYTIMRLCCHHDPRTRRYYREGMR